MSLDEIAEKLNEKGVQAPHGRAGGRPPPYGKRSSHNCKGHTRHSAWGLRCRGPWGLDRTAAPAARSLGVAEARPPASARNDISFTLSRQADKSV
jgi:hypothetical protein